MRFKELHILPRTDTKKVLRGFFSGIFERCLIRVTMPHHGAAEGERQFHYLAENGKGKRLSSRNRFCPACCDVRTDAQVQICASVRDSLDSFCRLCGAEVWELFQVDASTGPTYGALSRYSVTSKVKRHKATRILFFKGAKIFQSVRNVSENQPRSS